MEKIRKNGPLISVHHPKLAMVSMLLGAFVGMFSETSLNIALPTLVQALQVNTGTIQWLVTGYMLVIGIVLPLSSLINRWFTTCQVIIFALSDFIIGAAISALGSSFAVVLVGRMIQGIGTGLILPFNVCGGYANLPATKDWCRNGDVRAGNYVCASSWIDFDRADSRKALLELDLLALHSLSGNCPAFCDYLIRERWQHYPSPRRWIIT